MPLSTCLALAFGLRAAMGLYWPNYVAPDEIYQYLEQAHRLVYGQGVVPWEFQVGLRIWLIPFFLAIPLEAGRLLGLMPWYGVVAARLLTAGLSLVVVGCATGWGWKFHGARGAWICGLLAALWPDLWLMAPHPMEDTLGAYALIGGLYLIEPWPRAAGLGRVGAAASCLALAFVLRNPLAPAIAVAGIGMCRGNRRYWGVSLAVGGAVLLAAGLLDWVTWGMPFRSFYLNVLLNGFAGVSRDFGTEGVLFYPLRALRTWLWGLPLIVLCVAAGARQLKLSALVAAVAVLTFASFPHKEWRFLFPAIVVMVPLMGLGLCWLMQVTKPILAPLSALVMLSGAASAVPLWVALHGYVAGSRAEMALAPLHPHRIGVEWGWFPGSLYLGAGTQIDAVPKDGDLRGFDALIAPPDRLAIGARFRLVGCFENWPGAWPGWPLGPLCAWVAPRYDRRVAVHGLGEAFFFPPAARPYILKDWQKIP